MSHLHLYMCWTEDNSWELVFSYYVGSGDRTQIVGLGGICFVCFLSFNFFFADERFCLHAYVFICEYKRPMSLVPSASVESLATGVISSCEPPCRC